MEISNRCVLLKNNGEYIGGNMENNKVLLRVRLLTLFFIFCLVVSGLTAFSLLAESKIITQWFGIGTPVGDYFPRLADWLSLIHEGLSYNASHYPFLAYGTDWLAFAHIVIAVFFIGVVIDPVRNVWIVKSGIIACILIPVLALLCGPVRGIPYFWRLLDSSFGVFGIVPLVFICRWIKQIPKDK